MSNSAQTWFNDVLTADNAAAPAENGRYAETAGLAPDARRLTHTLFEFDEKANALVWSDGRAMAQLLNLEGSVDFTPLAEFDSRIVGAPPTARAVVFKGEAQNYTCEYQLTRHDGRPAWYEERGGWIGIGAERRLIGVVRTIDDEKRINEELSRRAEYDDLTGALNRSALRERLDETLMHFEASGETGAYILAGIDDVAVINADFGFEAADGVIRDVALRIASVVGGPTAMGRVAGTKFGIVLDRATPDEVRLTCMRLLNVVREHVIDTDRGAVAASICLGAINLPTDGVGANGVMARAEAALDQAKRIGRSSWATYSEKPMSSACAAATPICRT